MHGPLPFSQGDRPAPERSDEELVQRARANEPDAIHAIYERYAAAVYRRFTHTWAPIPNARI